MSAREMLAQWAIKAIQKWGDGQFVPVKPAPLVGWSQSGSLFTHNNTIGPAAEQVQLQCQFNNQMQTHTVQFNAPDNTVAVAGSGILVEAEILWSVEGGVVRRLVSVLDGMAVSGVAQSVIVNVRDVSLTNIRTEYQVGITVAPGVRGSIHQPPTLRSDGIRSSDGARFAYVTNLAPGDSAVWTVPANCGAVSSYITVDSVTAVALTDVDVRVLQRAVSGVTQKRYGYNGCFSYVPLYPICRDVTITNTRAVGDIQVSNTFGIEG